MNHTPKLGMLFLVTLFLTACATTPKFETSGIDLSITPNQAANKAAELAGTSVLWGGIIINSANLKEETQLEILAYPLDSSQRPDHDKKPLGRFLAVQAGYMETSDFAPGRRITLSGTLQANRMGRIGESEYTYPVLNINRIQLWGDRGKAGETSFHFGVGVMLHN